MKWIGLTLLTWLATFGGIAIFTLQYERRKKISPFVAFGATWVTYMIAIITRGERVGFWVTLSVSIISVAYCVLLPIILDNTPSIKTLRGLNQQFYQLCPQHHTHIDAEYKCDSKNEFDRWPTSPQARMENILDSHETWCKQLPDNMKKLHKTYNLYAAKVTDLYRNIEAPLIHIKQKRFKRAVIAVPNNIILTVTVTYRSPGGRNHYEREYHMLYQDATQYIQQLLTPPGTYSPHAFLSAHCKIPDCAGTYVLHNTTDNMYYVGQATSIIKRMKQHFGGRGNGDVYADFKYGKNFQIYIFPIEHSHFTSLNEQERYYIAKYNAFKNGYNKTHGNM